MKIPALHFLLSLLPLTASAATRTWSGGAITNDFWGDHDNWAGNVAPIAGDVLIFPVGAPDRSMRNTLGSTVLQRLDFQDGNYSVNGDAVLLSGGLKMGLNDDALFKADIVLTSDQAFDIDRGSRLTVDKSAALAVGPFTLTLRGTDVLTGIVIVEDELTGSGAIVMQGPLTMLLLRSNLFSGPITIGSGCTVFLEGESTVGTDTFGSLGSAAGATFIRGGGVLAFVPGDEQTVLETLHLDAGGRIQTSNGPAGAAVLNLQGPLIFDGPGLRTMNCESSAPSTITTRLTGRISGSGELNKTGTQPLFINGTTANTFAGSFHVDEGIVALAKPAGVAALACADVSVGEAGAATLRLDANEQVADTSHLHVMTDGTFSLNGKTETVASLEMCGGVVSGPSPSLLIVTGNITSPGSGQINANARVLGAPTVLDVADGAAADDLIFNASLNCPVPASLRKTGPGTALLPELTGNRPVEIQAGTLTLGQAGGSAVTLNGGTLTGTGQVGIITSAAGGGTFSPGDGLGSRVCGQATFNAVTTFAVEILSPADGGHDVLSVFGTVNLGGAQLQLIPLTGFSAGIGEPITIIDNDGTDAIIGTFAGLPQNSEVLVGAARYRISYTGGTGNDVTLAVTFVPPTGVTRTWTGNAAGNGTDQAANWNPVIVPQPGDTLLFPAGPADKNVVDTIAFATPYDRLQFTAGGYTLDGSGIALTNGISASFASGDAQTALPLLLTQNQTFTASGGANLIVSGTSIGAVNLNGHALTLNPVNSVSSSSIEIGVDTAALGPNDGIFGNGGVTKIGDGNLEIKCFNSYTGPTTVQSGLLLVRHNDALGASGPGNGTTIAAGASCTLSASPGTVIHLAEDLVLEGPLSSFESMAGFSSEISGTLTLNSTPAAPVRFSVMGGELALTGVIQGTGGFDTTTFSIGEGLIIGGTSPNTFTGAVLNTGAMLSLHKPDGVTAIAGPVTVNSGELRLLANEQLTGQVEVRSLFNLNGFNETLPALLLDGGTVQGAGTLTLAGSLALSGPAAASTIASNVALSGASQTWIVADGAGANDLTVSGIVSGTLLAKTGGGRIAFSNSNTLGSFRIDSGSAIFTGNSTLTAISLNGGTLGGTGTVGAVANLAGGTVAPGLSTGILHCGNVALGAANTFAVELQTATAGTGYDQLTVTGTVSLGNATLATTLLAGATLTPSDVLTIIANDGADAVTGTFAGLAQNATFSVSGKTFRISYTGGTGNDVTLQLFTLGTGITRTWDGGGADSNWTTPANWDGNATAPSAGDDLLFPLISARRTNVNNLAANTTFNSIRVIGNGYSISGAAVVLNDGLSFDGGASSVLLPITLSQAQTFSALNNAVGTVDPSTALNIAGFALNLHAATAASQLTVSDISGTGTLSKDGLGTASLSANTYTGPTFINAGTVTLPGVLTGLGGTASGTTVAAGAVLRFNGVPASTLAEPITVAGTLRFDTSPVTCSGAVFIPASATALIEVNGTTPAISSAISGDGELRKTGTGELILSGTAANTFTGGLSVASGVVRLQKTAGIIAAPGAVTIGDGTATAAEVRLITANQITNSGTTTLIGSGALLNTNALAETIGSIAMTGGTISTGGGVLIFNGSFTHHAAATPATLNGNLTASFSGVRIWTIEDGAAADDVIFTGVLAASAGTRITKWGEGKLTFSGNSSFPRLQLDYGTASFTGSSTNTFVDMNGGTLTGGGFTGAVNSLFLGGTISPGASPGLLTAASNVVWNAQTQLNIELHDTTPVTGFDQFSVLGTIALGDAVLSLATLPGFVSSFGDSFKIVDNNGTADPVVGTFAGLAEGALIDLGIATIRISYAGGDGNDVVLTTMVNPTGITRVWDGAPDGGGASADANWMTASNWAGDAAPSQGDALEFPAAAVQKASTNNFPANTTFASLRFTGSGYAIANPNAIVLHGGIRVEAGLGGVNFTPALVLDAAQTFFTGTGSALLLNSTVNTNGQTLTADTTGLTQLIGLISGNGGFVTRGAGLTTLSGNNTFTGPVHVEAGTLQLNSAGALGATSGPATVDAGAVLSLNGITSSENISLAGTLRTQFGSNLLTGTLTTTGAAQLTCNTPLTLSGVIAGSGSLTKNGIADLSISGSSANTFTGGFVITEAIVRLQKLAGAALPGPVTVGDATGTDELQLINANQIADTAVVAVLQGGLLNLNNLNDTIGGLQMTGGTVNTGSGTLTLDGNLSTLASTITATLKGRLFVKGTAGTPRTWAVADGLAADDLTVEAVISGSGGVPLRKKGSGRALFTAANDIAEFVVADGQSFFTGASTTSVFMDGGTLGGTGSVAEIFRGAGTVAPGLSPGIFTVDGNVTWSADTTFAIELNGLASGTQYDRLNAGGDVDLGGASLTATLGFTPPIGSSFNILRNSGNNPVTGTFAGLPEGALLALPGARVLQISYQGNDGNDVLLTSVEPPAPVITSSSITPGSGAQAGQYVTALTGTGIPGAAYALETSTDLMIWSFLQTTNATPAGAWSFSDTSTPVSGARAFFRVRLQ